MTPLYCEPGPRCLPAFQSHVLRFFSTVTYQAYESASVRSMCITRCLGVEEPWKLICFM